MPADVWLVVEAKPGRYIVKAIQDYMQARQEDRRVIGFRFNGKYVQDMTRKLSLDELIDEWNDAPYKE